MSILGFISNLSIYNGNYDNGNTISLISWSIYILSNVISIIGIIVLSLGAIKTMAVPLTFSREKGAKGSPRKIVNKMPKSCPSCEASLPPGAEFCTNCGNHL